MNINKKEKFKSKEILLISIIYFFALVLIVNINQLEIPAFVMEKGPDDDLTFFMKSLTFSIRNLEISKYIINSALIVTGVKFNFGLNSMHIYGYLKGFIQIFSVIYFSKSIIRIYGKNIAFYTLLIILFDPYLFSLKLTLLRDDLICSFGLLLIGAFLNNTKFFKLNFLSLKNLPFYIGFFGLLGTKPALAPLLIASFIFIGQINFKSLKLLKDLKIKWLWLLLPILIIYLFVIIDQGGYRAQIVRLLTPSFFNILLTLQKHFLSPLPGNELLRSGIIVTDASAVYWWYEIRFFFVILSIFIILLNLFNKPNLVLKNLSIIGLTGLIISLAYSQLQDLDYMWGLTAGPRQGYLSYLLLVPGSLSIISKTFAKLIK